MKRRFLRLPLMVRLRPTERSHVAGIAETTPAAMLGHILNTTIALPAAIGFMPSYLFLLWASYSYAIGIAVLWSALAKRQNAKHAARPSMRATRKAVAFACALALPWSALSVAGFGSFDHHREAITIALATGMAAAGSVLLSPIPPAAIIYIVVILVPVALKAILWSESNYDLLLGALAFSYGMFLLALVKMSHRIFVEKSRAVRNLQISVAAIKSASSKVEHVAMHDALTGLHNRRALLNNLQRLTECGLPFALIYMDLDRFKDVNDSFGHGAGDELLGKVAARLRSCLRADDVIARLGGDEFAIIAPNITQRSDAQSVAIRLIDSLRRPYDIGRDQVVIGVSIGIVLPEYANADAHEQMKLADLAMYAAKESGSNLYRLFEPDLRVRVEAKRAVEKGLREAIHAKQFRLMWQPIVDLKTQSVIGLEALLRWEHPERGLVSPAEFLPIAEETGLIREIGEWVVAEACRKGAAWPEVRISVNLSPLQLASNQIIDVVRAALNETGLSPGRLQLEITESAILQDAPEMKQRLVQLKELGVSLAMDDFGTGYSSLSYVANYPFDCIKIDRSFVAAMNKQQSADPIIRAIIQLAKALDCRTVAEGIETEQQAHYLKQCGADFGQGYYFSRPVRDEEVIKHLNPAALAAEAAAA